MENLQSDVIIRVMAKRFSHLTHLVLITTKESSKYLWKPGQQLCIEFHSCDPTATEIYPLVIEKGINNFQHSIFYIKCK